MEVRTFLEAVRSELRFRAACDEWISALGEHPLAGRLADFARAADGASSATAHFA